MSFEVIDSQEKLDAVIKDRVERAKKTARAEAEKEAAERYADYDALRKAAEEAKANAAQKDARIKELEETDKANTKAVEDLTAKLGRAELEHTRYVVATEAGLPMDLAGRLAGETEEELRADAEKLRALMGVKRVPPLGDYEKTPTDSKKEALRGMLNSMRGE